jgi:hypothetical protein
MRTNKLNIKTHPQLRTTMALNREEVNMKNVLAFGEQRGVYLACTRRPQHAEGCPSRWYPQR